MTQLALDLAPLVTPTLAGRPSIDERYAAWIAANPWVLDAMETLVAQWLAAGHARVGIKAVWERIRWEYGTTYSEGFTANNDFTSRIARDLIARHPEWAAAIETRALRSKEK